MKKAIISVFALFLCVCLLYPGIAPVAYANDLIHTDDTVISIPSLDADFADNRVMVVLTREASLDFHTYTTSDFADIGCAKVTDLSDATAAIAKSALEQAAAVLASGGTPSPNAIPANHQMVISNYKQVLCLELNAAGKKNVIAAIKLLSQRDDVIYAGPDYILTVDKTYNNISAEDAVVLEAQNQWAADIIDLYDAQALVTNPYTVTVGIIDTGIDGDHPELRDCINVNLCRDFCTGTAVATGVPVDPAGHGTYSAGIIAAQGNVNGVCPSAQLVSLKVLDEQSYGPSSWTAAAINFATAQNIDILNLSLRWNDENANSLEAPYDYALETVIHNYPGLFVCSAGNENRDNDVYNCWPANYTSSPSITNMITVGASTSADNRWVGSANIGSNYGLNNVNIFAPGHLIYTTSNGGGYTINTGVSFATPFVAGVAALLLSRYPALDANSLKQTILNNVDMSSAFSDLCTSGGRLNAYKALTNIIHNCSQHSLYTYTNVGLIQGHARYCIICEHTLIESHIWKPIYEGYKCSKCDLISSFIPADPQDFTNETLMKLKSVVVGDEGYIHLDEDTMLCFVGGQYYLVRGMSNTDALHFIKSTILK